MSCLVRRLVMTGASVAMVLIMTGCTTTLPIVVDPSTYVAYHERLKKQKATDDHPLLGVYSMTFSGRGKLDRPEEGRPITGDWKVIAIKRGGSVDFISMSGMRGAAGTDAGGSFSVNFQGATLWSFPWAKNVRSDKKQFEGEWSGITGGRVGVSILEILPDGWIRIQTMYTDRKDVKTPASGDDIAPVTDETAFLQRASS